MQKPFLRFSSGSGSYHKRKVRHGRLVIREEDQLWRERYRVLFGENVAGTILTTPEGRIVDCNEECARIFGFDSKEEVLAHTAWDFYFNRAEREILLDRLRAPGNSRAEDLCLRGRDGAPIWVIARPTVASYVDGVPELLQGTLIDINARKEARARQRAIEGGQSSGETPEDTRISDLSKRIGNILRRVDKSLAPDNLPHVDRAELQECFLALEEMKMLMVELGIPRLDRK